MNRFFAAKEEEGSFSLSKEDQHHLLTVLRSKEKEEIEIVWQGELFLSRIEKLSPLRLIKIKKLDSKTELPCPLYLGFSLLKGGRDELVFQKGTELGVSGFYPFISQRTIISLDEKDKRKRLDRYQKIVLGAAMQSKRLNIPFVHPILSFKELLEAKANHRFIAYEELASHSCDLLKKLAAMKPSETTLCLIGPEGGFRMEEVAFAKEKGFEPISLGSRILRAETASLYFASVFSSVSESENESF